MRTGRAGFGVRIGLSVAAAGLSLSGAMLTLGLMEAWGRRVRDEHVAGAMGLSLLLWCALLCVIWATFPRWRRALLTGLTVVVTWAVTIAAIAAVNMTLRRGDEFLTAACIFGAATATVVILTSAIHTNARGRELRGADGRVDVRCPRCGYSMAGLESSVCPECGSRYVLEELVRLQDYEALREPRASSHGEHPASGPAGKERAAGDAAGLPGGAAASFSHLGHGTALGSARARG